MPPTYNPRGSQPVEGSLYARQLPELSAGKMLRDIANKVVGKSEQVLYPADTSIREILNEAIVSLGFHHERLEEFSLIKRFLNLNTQDMIMLGVDTRGESGRINRIKLKECLLALANAVDKKDTGNSA